MVEEEATTTKIGVGTMADAMAAAHLETAVDKDPSTVVAAGTTIEDTAVAEAVVDTQRTPTTAKCLKRAAVIVIDPIK